MYFFESSTLPGGFIKKTMLVSPIWTWSCITMLTLADFTRDDVGSQRLKFGSTFLRFLGSQNCLAFLTFPYPLPVPKNCIIFVGCNFKSRASQVGLHKQKKDTASAKKWKVSLDKTQGCALDLTAQDLAPWTWLGDWKYCLAGPAGRLAGVGFLFLLICSQTAKNV